MASGTGRHHQSKARRRDSPSTKRKLEADTYDLVIIDMLMPGEGEPDASNPTTQKHCKSRVRPYREAKPVRRTEVHILDSNELAARLTDMLYLAGHHGLGEPLRAGMAAGEHAWRRLLRRGSGRRLGAIRQARNL
jgi:hypothetical protein